MRTNLVLSLTLLLTVVSAADTNSTASSGGSLEKLLARIAHQSEPKANPDFVGNSTRVRNHVGSGGKNHTRHVPTAAAVASEAAGTVELPVASAAGERMARRIRKVNEENDKRYYQGASIIQDDTPTSVIPIEGGGANTPTFVPVAPTFPPLDNSASATTVDQAAALASVSSAHSKGLRASLRAKQNKTKSPLVAATPAAAKRWIWAASIIQDDTPSSDVPAVGENANLLNTALDANTPTVTLVAPTFPALVTSAAASASSVASVVVDQVESVASAVSSPIIAVVRGALSSSSPVSSSTHAAGRQAIKASTATAVAGGRTALKAANLGRAVTVKPVLPKTASTTTSKPVTTTTKPATTTTATTATGKAVNPGKPGGKRAVEEDDEETSYEDLEAEEEIEYYNDTEDYEESEIEKRYIWSNSIIQDDSPSSDLPAVGANANLLSSDAASIATPTISVTAPTFAPESINIIPVVLDVTSSASPVVPTSSSLPIRNHRHPIVSHHNLAKKYIWANSIINDDSNDAPDVGINTNMLMSGYPADTPKVTLIAPSFPPLSPTAASATATPTVDSSNLASNIKVVPAVSSAPSVASNGNKPHRHPLTASVLAAMAKGNRLALSEATAPQATVLAKKDTTVSVDTLRRLLKEKREAEAELSE